MGQAERHAPPRSAAWRAGPLSGRPRPASSRGHTGRYEQVMTVLYQQHYRPLTQLATLLTGDVATAEGIVQDAFVAMHATRQLRAGLDAGPGLLQEVIRRARFSQAPPGFAAGSPLRGGAGGEPAEPLMVAALQYLPARQRESLVLRYYADLTDEQIGAAIGVSPRVVRDFLSRGMTALQGVLARAAKPGDPRS
jgi:DNA-directed RNA polymerase specialized sigma24 family protein